MKHSAKSVALGGVLAALSVVIMTMGGVIPIATYVCPMLCSIVLLLVKLTCGKRIGWAWYFTVSILSLLLSPDKEAAAVFLAMGYYPLIQAKMDTLPFAGLWKCLFFNVISLILYSALLFVFGMTQLIQDFQELGIIGLIITLILGNICFFMLDYVLKMLPRKFRRNSNG